MTPILITSFAGPIIAEHASSQFGWRVAFSVSAGILSIVCPPLGVVLFHAQSTPHKASGNTKPDHKPCRCCRLRRFAVELDIPGVFFAITGFCLMLLPLTHPPGAPDSWEDSAIIAMMVLGICSLVGLVVWENALAPAPCVPLPLLSDRNVLGACLVGLFSAASAASWDSYYGSYLQVVHDKTAAVAGLITESHWLIYALFAPFIGL